MMEKPLAVSLETPRAIEKAAQQGKNSGHRLGRLRDSQPAASPSYVNPVPGGEFDGFAVIEGVGVDQRACG